MNKVETNKIVDYLCETLNTNVTGLFEYCFGYKEDKNSKICYVCRVNRKTLRPICFSKTNHVIHQYFAEFVAKEFPALKNSKKECTTQEKQDFVFCVVEELYFQFLMCVRYSDMLYISHSNRHTNLLTDNLKHIVANHICSMGRNAYPGNRKNHCVFETCFEQYTQCTLKTIESVNEIFAKEFFDYFRYPIFCFFPTDSL